MELVLNDYEQEKLRKILSPIRKKLLGKREKYRDIHDGGEATARQETTLSKTECYLEVIEKFF